MQNTIAIIVFLNAQLQPARVPDVVPLVMSQPECATLSKNDAALAEFRAQARTKNPTVETVMIACLRMSEKARADFARSLSGSLGQ